MAVSQFQTDSSCRLAHYSQSLENSKLQDFISNQIRFGLVPTEFGRDFEALQPCRGAAAAHAA
jgi:hypothetical protein